MGQNTSDEDSVEEGQERKEAIQVEVQNIRRPKGDGTWFLWFSLSPSPTIGSDFKQGGSSVWNFFSSQIIPIFKFPFLRSHINPFLS